jgi:hypothetical protein
MLSVVILNATMPNVAAPLTLAQLSVEFLKETFKRRTPQKVILGRCPKSFYNCNLDLGLVSWRVFKLKGTLELVWCSASKVEALPEIPFSDKQPGLVSPGANV